MPADVMSEEGRSLLLTVAQQSAAQSERIDEIQLQLNVLVSEVRIRNAEWDSVIARLDNVLKVVDTAAKLRAVDHGRPQIIIAGSHNPWES